MKRFSKKILSILFLVVAAASFVFMCIGNKSDCDNFSYAESSQETAVFLQNLSLQTNDLPLSYDISKNYSIDSENQLSTNFCWLFSSLKCLETSYMIQQGMQYNFSETAMAYINFVAKKENGQSTFDTTGNMLSFYTLIRQYGLVFENDVSNDYLLDINEVNYKNYSFINDAADKNLSNKINLISFGDNYYFSSQSYYTKIMLMRAFIKNYGALFLAFDDGDGILYQTSTGMPEYSKTSEGYDENVAKQIGRHAVCLIGWDNGGFIALNSWGKGNEYYEMFHISYDKTVSNLEVLMNSVRGFVVDDGSFVNLSQSESKNLQNVFDFGEKITLNYNILKNVNFNDLRIKILKGTEDVTYNFDVIFDNINSKIKIEDKFNNDTKNSGGYIVYFYENNQIFAKDSFLQISGTEISSVILGKESYGQYLFDYSLLNNAYISQRQTATFTISPYKSYAINIKLSEFSKCRYNPSDPEWNNFKTSTGEDRLFKVSTIKVLSVSGQSAVWNETSLVIDKNIDYDTNNFVFKLPNFSGANAVYQNRLIAFDITLNSTRLNSDKNTITIMCFISDIDNVGTSNNHSIYYELDGGKNAKDNIVNFPNYQSLTGMTSFVLQSPTKSDCQFLGWYKDKEFTKQVFTISSSNINDLCLYAKWDTNDVENYVDADIYILKIKDVYNNQDKNNEDDILYGDALTFNYAFYKKTALAGHNYSARLISYLASGSQKYFIDEINGKIINTDAVISFDLGYPNMDAGKYKIVVNAIITINNISIIESVTEYNFEVGKRDVYIAADNLEFEYDSKMHFPNFEISSGDIFEDDITSINFSYSLASRRDVGNYSFIVYLDNKNYKIADDETVNYNFVIYPKQLNIVWGENEIEFAATNQTPKYSLDGLVDGDIAGISLKNTSFYNIGDYIAEIDINSLTNKNYFVNESRYEFKIIPAKITILPDDKLDKLSVAPKYRQKLTYNIEGKIFNGKSDSQKQQIIEMLNLKISSDGLNATSFGKCDILVTISNNNFEADIKTATYKIIAPYKVFYKLPDGSMIEEQVEEGQQPKGLSRKDYNYTIFQVLEYSEPLYGDGTSNLHIIVKVKDYTYYVVIGGVVFSLICVYLFITRKQRHNKVS